MKRLFSALLLGATALMAQNIVVNGDFKGDNEKPSALPDGWKQIVKGEANWQYTNIDGATSGDAVRLIVEKPQQKTGVIGQTLKCRPDTEYTLKAMLKDAGVKPTVGVTAASGGMPRDLESADLWIDLLEKENISYCLWAFAKVSEACSTIRFNVPKYSGFVEEDYTDTGLWLLDTLAKHTTK